MGLREVPDRGQHISFPRGPAKLECEGPGGPGGWEGQTVALLGGASGLEVWRGCLGQVLKSSQENEVPL